MSTASFQPQEIKSPAWARSYSRYGTSFARSAAPRVRSFYESTYGDRADRSLLDVCCGQGTLALHFLKHGYRVTGIDLSEPMLAFAGRTPMSTSRRDRPGSSAPMPQASQWRIGSASPPRRSTP